MGYQETREIYVKVKSKEDYEKVKEIFAKYEISTGIKDNLVLTDVYVYMEDDKFGELREEVYEAVPGCLLLASCNKYHSVSGSCGYDIYAHYPNREEGDEDYSCDDEEESCPVYTNNIRDLKSCLDWIHRAGLALEPEDQIAIYQIWGEDVDEEAFLAAENDDSSENYLNGLYIKDLKTVGEVSKKCKTVYRLCAVAKDDSTLKLIKETISEYVENGEQIVSKSTYLPDKHMMYIVAGDLFEDGYTGSIEEVIEELVENAEGKFIILKDQFELVKYDEIYGSNDGYISEEGSAECSLGSDMKEFGWDCCTFDEEMEDNFDINITDVRGYLEAYGFEMEHDEKVYISSFK